MTNDECQIIAIYLSELISSINMSERLLSFIDCYRKRIENALNDNLPLSSQPHTEVLNEAIYYALFPGGKRWRPLLTLLGAEIVGGCPLDAMQAACAMEYLHTSSIILDDLPAMDDASLRRGRKTLHLVYGEPVALLAALSLLNESYALLARNACRHGQRGSAGRLVEEAVRSIGSNGMIGGQTVDLILQGTGQDSGALGSRCLKTTALMRLTMIAGAITCGADEEDAIVLGDFGVSLGIAYQICDDLLDELGASDQLGKPAKQDSRHCRSTYVNELGVGGAHRVAASIIESAEESLRKRFRAKPGVEMLSDAANMIIQGAGQLAVAAA
jgi:geranylgeranyl diphosphate synthase type II